MTIATQHTGLTGDLLVGGEDRRGVHGEFRAVDPATGDEQEPAFSLAGPEDVDAAATLAAAAFAEYRATSLADRAAFLDRIAVEMDLARDRVLDRFVAESGLPRPRAESELARTTGQLRLFAEIVREGDWLGARIEPALPERRPLPRPDLRQRMVPLGPVAVFAASNFPLAFSVAGGDTASALAAGCPVVVKAHSAHPGVSELVGRAVRNAVRACGLPDGIFSLLFGAGTTVGAALVRDPRIAAVGFTGSRAGGLALVSVAQQRAVPIPVYAEMSSVNPVFLLPGALAARAEEIASGFVASMTTGAGQLCTSPGLVFGLDGEDLDRFVAAAAAGVRRQPDAPMLTPGIRNAYTDAVARTAAHPAVSTLAEGTPDAPVAVAGRARLLETTGAELLADRGLQAEMFGAASLVVRLRDDAELRQVLSALEGQLTATVHAEPSDHATARALLPELELRAGRIVFNGWPTGVEVGDAMVHGGPFPATSAPATTSVGSRAIERFLRPVSYQDVPGELLPRELQDGNPHRLRRRVDRRPDQH